MKQLVKLNKRPRRGGRESTYALRYTGEDGKRRCESLGHTNLCKAERQRDQKEKELRMDHIEPCSMKLRDFMENSLERTGDQIRESIRIVTQGAVNDFIRTIGNSDIECRRMLKAAQEYTAKHNPKKSLKQDLMITVALATAMRRAELLNCT
jgi:integrase